MAISKTRRAELEQELLKTMDRADQLRQELKDRVRDAKKESALHEKKVRDLRDILSGREGEQELLPGTEAGTVKPRPAAPAKNAPGQTLADPVATRRRSNKFDGDSLDAICSRCGRRAGEHAGSRCPPKRQDPPARCEHGCGSPPHAGICTSGTKNRHASLGRARPPISVWVADRGATRVPTFVIDQTGLFKKAQIVAKYGENARFEKGKPTPRPASGSLLVGKLKAPSSKPVPAALSWTEGDGTLQVIAGTTTYRVQEITPTRWVLESKSERERAWHKEDVLASLNACESAVMKRHPGTTFVELCLDCGIEATAPSPGCGGCDHARHGRPAEAEEDVA